MLQRAATLVYPYLWPLNSIGWRDRSCEDAIARRLNEIGWRGRSCEDAIVRRLNWIGWRDRTRALRHN